MRIRPGRQHLDEQTVRFRVVANFIYRVQIPRNRPQGLRVDVELGFLGGMEQPQNFLGFLADFAAAHGQPAALDIESVDRFLEQPERRQPKFRFALMFRFERRAENPGQVADLLGDQVIVLHKTFDPARAGAIAIPQQPGDLGLCIEGQPVFATAGEIMQMTPDVPHEAVRAGETVCFLLGQHAAVDDIGDLIDLVQILGDPVERLQVAQPALAFLDVRFEHIARPSHFFVAGIALGEFLLDEFGTGGIGDFGVKPPAHFVIDLPVAPEIARFQHRGADGQVAPRKADTFVDRPRGLADLQFQVPQHVQDVFDHLFLTRGFLVGQDEKQIDIGIWRKFAPPVSANGGDAQTLALGRVRRRIDLVGREIVDQADDLVCQERQGRGDLFAIRLAGIEPAADFRPAMFHGRLEQVEERATHLLRR